MLEILLQNASIYTTTTTREVTTQQTEMTSVTTRAPRDTPDLSSRFGSSYEDFEENDTVSNVQMVISGMGRSSSHGILKFLLFVYTILIFR